VPACRREGTSYNSAMPPCDTMVQYYAHPSRRVAQVVRRFDAAYRNGLISSICRNDYSSFMTAYARQVALRFCP
jgi:hypothetical protein